MDKHQQGKRNKQSGRNFELRVRKHLESNNWIVSKWHNQVDLDKNILIQSKHKFNPFNKAFVIGTGFPDFFCYHLETNDFIGVEVKSNGVLSKQEKDRIEWLLKNNIFQRIYVAQKDKRKIIYKNYSLIP